MLTLVAGLFGCSSPMEKQTIDLNEVLEIPEDANREWSKVFSVTVQDRRPHRQHIGYLYRRFTADDPQGTTFVLNLRHEKRGFLLASGRTFLFKLEGNELVGSEDLGNLGLDIGVKRILAAPGAIEYEIVKEAATAAASSKPTEG
jgi:hypothetical protein